jgi:ribosomal protein S18 acetylase RimI-like enzyme
MAADKAGGRSTLTDVAADAALSPDAQILQRAMRESVCTSPDAFLATSAEIEARPTAAWESELQSSTWAVVEDGDKILGIAAAKRPGHKDMAYARPEEACFIESVWIAPAMRRLGLGERLVNYLIDIQRKEGIRQFYLWVLDQNGPAIELYERMKFKYTDRRQKPRGASVFEIQYVLSYDSDVVEAAELAQNAAARDLDRQSYGVTYRLLGCETAKSRPRYSKALTTESTRGSLVR